MGNKVINQKLSQEENIMIDLKPSIGPLIIFLGHAG